MASTSSAPGISLLGVASDPTRFSAAASSAAGAEPAPAAGSGGFQLLMAQAVQQTVPQQFLQGLLQVAVTSGNNSAPANPAGKPLPPAGAALPEEIAPLEQLVLDQLAIPVKTGKTASSDQSKPRGDDNKREGDDKQVVDGLQLLLNPLTPTPVALPPAGGQDSDGAASAETAAAAIAILADSGAKNTAGVIAQQPVAVGKSAPVAAIDTPAIDPLKGPALPNVPVMLAAPGKTTETEKTVAADFTGLVKQLDHAVAPPSNNPVGSSADASRDVATRQYQNAGGNATVTVPVGKPGWSDAVVDKVMWFSAQQINSAEIHLNPPDLGPLQVRISAHHDQASIFFTSPHAAVRDALDQALPRLREMMDGSGVQLLDVGVGGQGAAQQQAQQRTGGGGFAANAGAGDDIDIDGIATTTSHGSAARGVLSLVDAYA